MFVNLVATEIELFSVAIRFAFALNKLLSKGYWVCRVVEIRNS
jgi:hypothetical protein